MSTVELPDGTLIEFPDSMNQDQIKTAMLKFGRPSSSAAPTQPAAPASPPPQPTANEVPPTRDEQIDAAMRRRRMEMFGAEQTPWELLNDPNTPPEEKMQIAQQQVADNPRDWVQYTLGRLPFSVTDAYTALQTNAARQRFAEGKATTEDLYSIAEADHQAQLASEQGTLGKAADIVTSLPGLGAEFAMTGGAAAAARGAVAKAIPGAGRLARAARAATGVTAAAATRAALVPGYAAENYAERRAKGESEATAVVKGFVDSAIDFGTEELGAAIPRPKVMKALSEWLTRKTGKPIARLASAGYNGPLNEVLEERVSEALKGIVTDGGDFQGVTGDIIRGEYEKAGQQLLAEFAAFIVPGAAARAVNAIAAADTPRSASPAPVATTPVAEVIPEVPLPEATTAEDERRAATFDEVVKDERTSATSFLRDNPDRIRDIAALPAEPSRTAFAKATGIDRAASNKAMRAAYVQAARKMAAEQPTKSPVSTQESAPPDLVAMAQKLPSKQMTALLEQPQAQEAFREQLNGMSASRIAEKFGYGKGKRKQWMIDRIVDRYSPKSISEPTPTEPPPATSEMAPTQAPVADTIPPPAAAVESTVAPVTAQPTPATPTPTSPSPAEEMTPQVQAVHDQLPDNLGELETLAVAVGYPLPKRGTRDRKALKAPELRVALATAMASPSSRKGLIGEIPAPTEPPVQMDVKPVQMDVTQAIEPVKPKKKGRLELSPRDVSDAAVKEGLAKLKKYGFEPKVVTGKDQVHRDIESLAAKLGVRAVYTKHGKKPNWTYYGFTNRGVMFIDVDHPLDAVWGVAGHEIAHAAQIDRLRDEFDADVVEKYAQQHYDTQPERVKQNLDKSPELRFREGIARIVQEFMGDSKLRTKLRTGTEQQKTVWKEIIDKVSQWFDKVPVVSKEMKTVERVLRNALNTNEYREAEVGLRVRNVVDVEIEAGNVKESQRSEAEDALRKEIDHVYKEALSNLEDREAAKEYIKRRVKLNASQIAMLENKGRDSASIKGLDTAASDAASMWPGVFSGTGHEDSNVAYGEEGFALIREPKQEPPKIDNYAIFEEAVGRVFGSVEADDARQKELLKEVKQGQNKEIFDEIVALVEEDVANGEQYADVEQEALNRLRQLIDQGDDDVPFMAGKRKGKKKPVAEMQAEYFLDPRLRKIAEIPGALDLARKLFRNPDQIPTTQEVESQRLFGRANPGKTLTSRDQVLAEQIAHGRPSSRSQSWDEKRAAQLLDKHGPEKYLKRFAERFRAGEFYFKNNVEATIARDLINQTAVARALTGNEQAQQDFADLIKGYTDTGSETGRLLAQRRDPITTNRLTLNNRALLEAIFVSDPKVRKAIQDALDKEGLDYKNPEFVKDSIDVAKAISIAYAHTPSSSRADMVYEFYLNSILSGIKTQVANVTGNVTNAAWYNTVERIGEIAMSKMTQPMTKGEQRDWRELVEVYKGIGAGIKEALSNTAIAWKYEFSPLNYSLGREYGAVSSALARKGGAIPGKVGRIVRVPFRALSAMDELARTITAHAAVGGQAYRQAKFEGVPANKIADRISQLMSDRSSSAWQKAIAEADYQAFQGELGVIGSNIKQGISGFKKIRGVRYVIPFDSFLVRSFSRAADLMPVTGAVTAAINQIAFNKSGGKVGLKPNWNRVLGNQFVAMASLAGIDYLLSQKDDDEMPVITGTRDRKLAARSTQYRTAPPLSIRIGDKYYSYSRIEPFNVWISTMVDYRNALRKGDVSAASALEKSMIAQIQDKNYMQGFADIMAMFEQEGNATDLALNTAVGFVPNIYRQASRETRNAVLDTRTSKAATWSDIGKMAMQKAELPVSELLYRYDIWGRKLNPNTPQTSLPYRLIVPAAVKAKSDVLPVDVAIMQWNETHPDKARNFAEPGRVSGVDDVTPKEFSTYARERGLHARSIVDKIKFTAPPTKSQMDSIANALTEGSSVAKHRLLTRRSGRKLNPLPGWDD